MDCDHGEHEAEAGSLLDEDSLDALHRSGTDADALAGGYLQPRFEVAGS
jgi:hypothetical protein